jgi:coenzyme F420 hydrogenase subunit beta
MSADVKGPQELRSEVGAKFLCTLCGGCAGMCPYRVAYRGRIVVMDECNRSQGRCYAFCPRTSVDLDQVSQAVFGVPYAASELGTVQEITVARAKDETTHSKAQHGGTVSALMSFALRQGFIDSAVLTSTDEQLQPIGTTVRDEAGVLAYSGSNFVASPTLQEFNREAATDAQSIGVVATPCQALALRNMRVSPLEETNNIEKLNLVVGLFCNWALWHEGFARFLQEKVQLGEVTRMDAPPPPANVLEVWAGSNRIPVPLDEVRPFINKTCQFCIDLTAELADVSVGAAEGVDGWNTLIVRSEGGKKLVKAAIAGGAIETAPLPKENLDHLKEAALLKKKRALKKIVDETGSAEDLLHLEPSREALDKLPA